jgi:hypothetical protein
MPDGRRRAGDEAVARWFPDTLGGVGRRGKRFSGAFWRGCAVIVVLSVVSFSMLVSGGYSRGVTAPGADPLLSVCFTAVLAGIAFIALWRWERRNHDAQ